MKMKQRNKLIDDAKGYLKGYHIDLSQYMIHLTKDDDITITIEFMAKDSKKTICLSECYYNDEEILQGKLIFG